MQITPADKYAIVILAAGKSARLGSPKQLLTYNGKSLLKHAVDAALETGCQSVFVILGATIELMREELNHTPVVMVENSRWQEGLASSIRCGLERIETELLLPDSVIFMVCDQPYVTGSLLMRLIEKNKETGKPIVASSYDDKMGTPTLFHKSFFPALMELKGDKGAQKLITGNLDKVATVQFPEGITDIDTTEDYTLLQKKNDY